VTESRESFKAVLVLDLNLPLDHREADMGGNQVEVLDVRLINRVDQRNTFLVANKNIG
jgi:hypothetical protein